MKDDILPSIYCVMMTGKNEDRYKFVDIAIENFNQQTYVNKFMIIINHGTRSLDLPSNITEVMFDKRFLTLGDMRNYSIDLIPQNALWTIWDDDDWRHDKYLELLYKKLLESKADVVFLKNRLDYNMNNNFVYRCKFDKGMPFFLAKKTEVIRYLAKDSLEDIRLYNDFELYNKKIYLMDNDPRLYIRTLHIANTSLYVDNTKNEIVNYSSESNYHEYDAIEREKEYAKKIIDAYFQEIINPKK